MSTVVDRVKERVGWRDEPREHVIAACDVARFCASIGDDSSRWEAEIPPSFLLAVGWNAPFERITEADDYGRTWLNAGDRFEYYQRVKVGARLHSQTELIDVVEKHGDSGSLLFLVFETLYRGESGEPVARHTGTRVRR